MKHKDLKSVGKTLPRIDAIGKVTGKAVYTEDIKFPGMLYGKVLRPPYPHAKIISIDTSQAEELVGVEAVLTHKDIPGSNKVGVAITADQRILADDKVRYMGDGVALVAAKSEAIADKACSLIKVEYQQLPSIHDPEKAMSPQAPKIHGDSNVVCHHKVRKGDTEKGFKESDIILERDFTTQMIEHSYIEPECVVGLPLPDGGIKLYGCFQNIFTSRRIIAQVLNLPIHKVEAIQTNIGGSFGGKDDVMNILGARVGLLALKTGRPVKITYAREESMIDSYKRHPYKLKYKIGLMKDGTIKAAEIQIFANAGAYASMTEFVTWRSVVHATGPYRVENVSTDVYGVYTNSNYTGAMRGFGSPQIIPVSYTHLTLPTN